MPYSHKVTAMNTPPRQRFVFALAALLAALSTAGAEAAPWIAQWGPVQEGEKVLLRDKSSALSVTFPAGIASVASDSEVPGGKALALTGRLEPVLKAANALPLMARLYLKLKVKPVEADAKGFHSAIITGARWELRYNMGRGSFVLVVYTREEPRNTYEVEVPSHLDTWNDIQVVIDETKFSLRVGKAECIRIVDGPSLTPFDRTSLQFFRTIGTRPPFIGGVAEISVAEEKP